MTFVHEDADFENLLRIVAAETRIAEALIEKDYWVTHSLWALLNAPVQVWFKGGTSLSKGFGLIKRFSEDLDLKVEPTAGSGLESVTNWRSTSSAHKKRREDYFVALRDLIDIPGAKVDLESMPEETSWRQGAYLVKYPGVHVANLPKSMRPFVQLEVGDAQVSPNLQKDLTSFVHKWLAEHDRLVEFTDNRPKDVRCLHPTVTLVEKLNAIVSKYNRQDEDPASFIRHYEDAASIIQAAEDLPGLGIDIHDLLRDMVTKSHIKGFPGADEPAFSLNNGSRVEEFRRHYDAISPMYWGDRITLEDSCELIRQWIDTVRREGPVP